MTSKLTGFGSSSRSSSLPPARRTLPPSIETNLFNQTQENRQVSPSGRPSSGSFTPITSPRGRTLPPAVFNNAHGSGSGPTTPLPSSSWRSSLPNFFSPRVRLHPQYREKFEALDDESKATCNGLSTEDVITYLVGLTDTQRQDFNEHGPMDRKAYLLLTPDERNDCSRWRDVGVRSLYLKLTGEEKKCYKEYETLLVSKYSENTNTKRGRINEDLKSFLERPKEERDNLYQTGMRLAAVRADFKVVKTWEGSVEELAARYCKTPDYVTHLRTYLASGIDREALREVGGIMAVVGLIRVNEFSSNADVEAWIQKNSN